MSKTNFMTHQSETSNTLTNIVEQQTLHTPAMMLHLFQVRYSIQVSTSVSSWHWQKLEDKLH